MTPLGAAAVRVERPAKIARILEYMTMIKITEFVYCYRTEWNWGPSYLYSFKGSEAVF